LRETVTILVVGLGVGLIAALVLTRILSGFVVDVGPVSLGRGLQAGVILSCVALVASAVPTARALRIDLAKALRVD
jgi:hypothetical protein